MEVHTCPDVRYWSEVLCCTILTHTCDLEVKVTVLQKLILKFLVEVLRGNAQFRRATLSCGSSYFKYYDVNTSKYIFMKVIPVCLPVNLCISGKRMRTILVNCLED